MKQKESYTGIDYFRVIAAFLIVAIHTSPLSSYNPTLDFILTRIIARIAVPFFFMISGFFLIREHNYDINRLKRYLKNMLLIYGIAIVMYIPINIYTGYFSMEYFLPNIIKDLVFDGTMYHLWYLPASIIGASLSWYLVKKIGLRWAFLCSIFLYIIGMLGDSYYGIAERSSFFHNLYHNMFEVSSYTRNGILFAPVFFILGGVIASRKAAFSLKKNVIGFITAMFLMILEGMILHKFDMQRHDSMYVMLVPCMFFLFGILIYWRGKRVEDLRQVSLVIYVIHPLVIILVRMCAKIIRIQEILISNSIIHYIVVSIVTLLLSIILVRLYKHIKKKTRRANVKKGNNKNAFHTDLDRSFIEIDLDNLAHNVRILQNAMPKGCELMAVVKAQAYGHGAKVISNYLSQVGIETFAVATIDEGIELRRYGIQGEILVMGYTSPLRAKELYRYNLTQTLIDFPYAVSLIKQGFKIKAHIKIDTGMHRLGFSCEAVSKIIKILSVKKLNITGIYTHLCIADSNELEDIEFTMRQISSFYNIIDAISSKGLKLPKIHIQSSYGLLNYPELSCDYVRVGIALYGVLSSKKDKTKLQLGLRPTLSLKSQIVLIREIKKNESVGYARTFKAMRDSRIAILPIGYADGLPRMMSCNNGEVLIRGKRVPIIGRICMDQLIIDVTDIEDVRVGDIATLIGKEGEEEISVTDIADNVDTITNELLSRMGGRLKIVEH